MVVYFLFFGYLVIESVAFNFKKKPLTFCGQRDSGLPCIILTAPLLQACTIIVFAQMRAYSNITNSISMRD